MSGCHNIFSVTWSKRERCGIFQKNFVLISSDTQWWNLEASETKTTFGKAVKALWISWKITSPGNLAHCHCANGNSGKVFGTKATKCSDMSSCQNIGNSKNCRSWFPTDKFCMKMESCFWRIKGQVQWIAISYVKEAEAVITCPRLWDFDILFHWNLLGKIR